MTEMPREGNSLRLAVVGLVLLMLSWLVLLLMVIGRVASGFLLTFGAFAVSVVGLGIGLFGAVQHRRDLRR
ncbi:MAG: hypothetical protein AUI83_00760 [Armatimonadetes bacterium 13_1_40CM_3_65_7]|nr:MAG: hypothetical protein AUI83_00760 [Armatimonadetes bacterium 13_1_40CM_3_65_7]